MYLLEVATTRVASRVSAEEAKDKEANKEGNREINNNFERDHFCISSVFLKDRLDIL